MIAHFAANLSTKVLLYFNHHRVLLVTIVTGHIECIIYLLAVHIIDNVDKQIKKTMSCPSRGYWCPHWFYFRDLKVAVFLA